MNAISPELDKTYKTEKNAIKALYNALDKMGINEKDIRYVIAVVPSESAEIRFAPAVIFNEKKFNELGIPMYAFPHNGISIIG